MSTIDSCGNGAGRWRAPRRVRRRVGVAGLLLGALLTSTAAAPACQDRPGHRRPIQLIRLARCWLVAPPTYSGGSRWPRAMWPRLSRARVL